MGLGHRLPDKATMSWALKPRRPKTLTSSEALKVGAGALRVSSILDLLPSFLPFGMSYTGPPDCNSHHDQTIIYQ